MMKVGDLFAGVGGMSQGFKMARDFEIAFAVEFDKDIAAAYKNNHKAVGIKAERPGNLFFKENAEILFEIEGACADCKQQKHQHIDNPH